MRLRLFVMACLSLVAFASAVHAMGLAQMAGPEGMWLVRDGRAHVEVKTCKTDQLCAHIIWLRQPNSKNGKPLIDANNDDPKLRKRPIIGLPVAYNMVPAGTGKWAGLVYDPERGGTYDGSLTLLADGRMKVTGCLGILCQSKFWTRMPSR